MLPTKMILGFAIIGISIFFLDIKNKPIITISTFLFGLYITISGI